ncbi:ABC transporter ATP-binding protein [Acetobacterium woodii]|uniref:Spermidine/putrescine import ATP-binding protein PotA n=1 Tax=Acetobacterium woodii (strain ATCC 29683 / DSM 1030 / JCM 2381 / KCTC 1655 / WB1) TaxID=931626 RepID=H6LF97_ACEWD|nr:ABC transporter ATP-binding protein [Acetobacterium woodii]AFA48197.1 spermidine/putrescine ABC transport system ATP-binding protein PotA [Acetobacterium woodii DSM 1030]
MKKNNPEKIIQVQNLVKIYGDKTIIDAINFHIQPNEFLTILGPSGCGKTTLLRMIGGFETPDSGDILFEGKSLINVPANKRPINTVFQKYALFPHLNVYDNVAFGLKIQKKAKAEITDLVQEMLRTVNLQNYEQRDVNSLSGGEQQRVAIARALINHPKLLLLDEPLGALDLKLRKNMQLELKNLQKKTGITFIYVTHDQEEAMTMSDTIIIMNHGRIQQIGSPVDIYNEPRNAFAADFIGESNILDSIMLKDCLVQIQAVEFPCVDKGFAENEHVLTVIRPEDIDILKPGVGFLDGVIESVTFLGMHYEILMNCQGVNWLIHTTREFFAGDQISIQVDPNNIHIMKKEFDHEII